MKQSAYARWLEVITACTVGALALVPFSGAIPLVIPETSTTTLNELGIAASQWSFVAMIRRSTNQNGCKSASLALACVADGRSAR